MTGTWFVDTNVLVYDRDTSETVKQPLATAWLAALWSEQCGRTSVQVLNEHFHIVTRKLDLPLSPEEAWRGIQHLLLWRPLDLDERVLRQAWLVLCRQKLNWWDCLIVAAARLQDCDYLLTEDLQDGQALGGVVVVNPFPHVPADFA